MAAHLPYEQILSNCCMLTCSSVIAVSTHMPWALLCCCVHVLQVLSYWQWQRTCPTYRAALKDWLETHVAVIDPSGVCLGSSNMDPCKIAVRDCLAKPVHYSVAS